jgi:hypothetical protein
MAQSPDSLSLGLLRIRRRKSAQLVKTEEWEVQQAVDDEFGDCAGYPRRVQTSTVTVVPSN